jgi:hypothetical protein
VLVDYSDEYGMKSIINRYLVNISMLQYVMKRRCAGLIVDKANCCDAVHSSLCQFDKTAVTYHFHGILSV